MKRHELTDDQWEWLAPFLPPQRPATGRPAKDHRTILNGIVWVLNTGAPWRDLPERYGSWQTVYSRFRRWQQSGLSDTVLQGLQADAAHDDTLDGSLTMIDGSTIRAHQHAAGARKGGDPADQGLGRSRGGFGSKRHLMTERRGKPITLRLPAGQRHESPEAIPLLEQAQQRLWPEAVTGDKGYRGSELRNWLAAREIVAVIPQRAKALGTNDDDQELYKERSMIERSINRLKRHRHIATRYEKLAATYLAMVATACILEWL